MKTQRFQPEIPDGAQRDYDRMLPADYDDLDELSLDEDEKDRRAIVRAFKRGRDLLGFDG
jgi:hypothetical protein